MLAVCIEASHQRGMGHLFRALNFVRYLHRRQVEFVILLNDYTPSLNLLKKAGIPFKTVPLDNEENNWELEIIESLGIKVWINDRLDTVLDHAQKIGLQGVRLVTLDDRGSGASLADLHFAGLAFDGINLLQGKKVFSGSDYLVLNPDIDRFKKIRNRAERILVTLGGTDTYGITVKIVEMLANIGRHASVVVGPGFKHRLELEKSMRPGFLLEENIPSLIEKFSDYDLAITGGGITPFEANASGLPCLTVSSEPFEVSSCKFLQKLGSSIYLGDKKEVDERILEKSLAEIRIGVMSHLGMSNIGIGGAERILNEIEKL